MRVRKIIHSTSSVCPFVVVWGSEFMKDDDVTALVYWISYLSSCCSSTNVVSYNLRSSLWEFFFFFLFSIFNLMQSNGSVMHCVSTVTMDE